MHYRNHADIPDSIFIKHENDTILGEPAAYRIIDDLTVGDTYKLTRILNAIPGSGIVSDAYWTVKSDTNLIDADAELALHITPTSSGIGTVTIGTDGSTQLQFIVQPTTSQSFSPMSTYYYDIQVNLVSGEKYMLESGKLLTGLFVTHSY